MKNFKDVTTVSLIIFLFILSCLVVMDSLVPKRVYQAERIESIFIEDNGGEEPDTYYIHFDDWMYEGTIDARPGDIVLVVYKKSRIFGNTIDREIHSEFKIKR